MKIGTDGEKTLAHEQNAFSGTELPVMLFVLPRKNRVLFVGLGKMQQSPCPTTAKAELSGGPLPPILNPSRRPGSGALQLCPSLPPAACREAHMWTTKLFFSLTSFLPVHSFCSHPYFLTSGLVLSSSEQFLGCESPVPLLSTPPPITQPPVRKADLLYLLPLSVNSSYHFS